MPDLILPLLARVEFKFTIHDGLKIKGMNVNLIEVYDMLETASNDMQEIFAVQ